LNTPEQFDVDFGKILGPETTTMKKTMGGKGSGRRSGFAERRTVQDLAHRALRISALKGFGQKRGYWIFPWGRSEQLIGSVRLWIQDGYIQVSYKERDSQPNWVEETVLLDGGKRDWFRCPTCNRRAGTLFIVGPPFGCRVCMGLAYQSQRQSAEERIRRQALRPKPFAEFKAA
jgi:hypothetical protein